MSSDLIKEQSRCIAHEIRNQVSICDVYCEILKKHLAKNGIEDKSINNAIDCIQKSVKMINNSLIDLKSLDNINPSVCFTQNLAEESIRLAKVYIFDKKINIISNIKTNEKIYVDENKFLACLINLIKNAIEAIDMTGEIIVTANTQGDKAVISVSNTGRPISQSAQKAIFNEGYTTKKTGSGLGLYICKNNLELQNSKLMLVQSTAKKTEFRIEVPVMK